MNTQQSKPATEAPKVSADLANIVKALVYTEDLIDRTRLTRIAKTFLAKHEKKLGGEEWVMHAKAKAFQWEAEDHKIPLYGPPA